MSQTVEPSFDKSIPEGDSIARDVCSHCGFIDYKNPKIVVGSVVRHEGKFLMCRRAIEPRRGFWTFPAGYLELNETPEAGAAREALEEANAAIRITGLLAIYSVPRISQVQLIFRSVLDRSDFSPGPESLEVALFDFDKIPRAEIAFPTVHWMLAAEKALEEGRATAPFFNPEGATADY